ncbi:Hypothetical predicted protein [Podarcis lilfordi]|uniref:Uncharacterized protein n=1 Tax=Podarcis lilfordi TaxID=74358 RepID=A0AA35NZI7_9SAUR|nr:Hypothetical predicted protein [Podarcis lilfordi]
MFLDSQLLTAPGSMALLAKVRWTWSPGRSRGAQNPHPDIDLNTFFIIIKNKTYCLQCFLKSNILKGWTRTYSPEMQKALPLLCGFFKLKKSRVCISYYYTGNFL